MALNAQSPGRTAAPARVEVARTVADLRVAIAELRAAGRWIALVPTMGALHDGHLSLLRLAGADGAAPILTLFVNPTQFAPGEDLASYPRTEARDLELAGGAGAELAFVPAGAEIYPDGFSTTISVAGPSEGLEGAARPSHFAGVATVVAKLLVAARPDLVVLGQKDAQQAAVVRRLMGDLHLDDIELVLAPTVREPDGLAMSSRNAYLDAEDRRAAAALYRGLTAARDLAIAGERDPARLEECASATIAAEPRCALEYAAVVNPDSFVPLPPPLAGPALLCVAARVGPARLIDNVPLPTT